MVGTLGDQEGAELMLNRLAKTQTNAEFLATLGKR
jgi:transcription termination factor Rho